MRKRGVPVLSGLLIGALLSVAVTAGVAAAAGGGDDVRLCSYTGAASGQEVFAPCSEGDTFVATMRELGYPDNTSYMPTVAADTCARVADGRPLMSWSSVGSEPGLDRAFRQAEIAARCPS